MAVSAADVALNQDMKALKPAAGIDASYVAWALRRFGQEILRTCSKAGTRYGWFASYAKTDVGRIVVVVFLQGGRPTFGPKAAEISGRIYRSLYDHDFFAAHATDTANAKPVASTQQ